MSLIQILPLAFVMIAGPQVITSFFLATSERFAANSSAYIAGATAAVATLVTAAYLVTHGAAQAGHKHTTHRLLAWALLVLLLVLMVRVFLTRNKGQPPRWMSRLQQAGPKAAFALGLFLILLGPGDILTSLSVGLRMARQNQPWWQFLPFVALTLLLLALPAIAVVFLGRRAQIYLPRVRDWMNQNSWVVSEIVLGIFVALTVKSLVA